MEDINMNTRASFCSLFLIFCLSLGVAGTALAAEGFVLIKNAKNPTTAVTKDEVKAIFTGKVKQWEKGGPVQVILGKPEAEEVKWLAEEILGVSVKIFLAKVKQEVFQGEMRKPLSAASEAESLQLVQENAGGIGIISAGAAKNLPSGVAILTLTLK
jgi:ABC-type phosphate transport system substrate-binding protein